MRFPSLLAVAALLLAGCSTKGPAQDPAPGPASEPEVSEWSWSSTEELGDWYMHVGLETEDPRTCTASLRATGHDGPERMHTSHGVWNGEAVTFGANAGSFVPRATAAGEEATVPYPPGREYSDDAPFPTQFVPGPGTTRVWFVGQGVGHVVQEVGPLRSDFGATTFRASIACAGPFRVVERAIGHARTFMAPDFNGTGAGDTLVHATSGSLEFDAAGNGTLFAMFHQGQQGTLTLRHADGEETMTMAPTDVMATELREGLRGPWRLELVGVGGVPATSGNPWLEGVVAAYGLVDAFPGPPPPPEGHVRQWSASSGALDGADVMWEVAVEADAPTTCTTRIDAAGAAPGDRMSRSYGMHAPGRQVLSWVSEPGSIGPDDGTPVPYEGGSEWSLQLDAGESRLYWAATGANRLAAGFSCEDPVRILQREAGTGALPRLGKDGTGADALFFTAATGSLDFSGGPSGRLLFGERSPPSGEGLPPIFLPHPDRLDATWDGGEAHWSWQSPEAIRAFTAGDVHLEWLMEGPVTFAVLGALAPVASLPGEASDGAS